MARIRAAGPIGDMPMPMPMMMPMTFSTDLGFQLLFSWWNINTQSDFAIAFIIVVAMGFVRRALAWLRTKVVIANAASDSKGAALLDEDGNSPDREMSSFFVAFLRQNQVALRCVDVILFAAAMTLAYFNMLVVMTYNPGLLMAVVTGEALGVVAFEPLLDFTARGAPASNAGCC